MSEEIKEHPMYEGLCIGGPLDGQMKASRRLSFAVQVLGPIPSIVTQETAVTTTIHHYRGESWYAPKKKWWLFLHESLTIEAAFDQLLDRYPKPVKPY